MPSATPPGTGLLLVQMSGCPGAGKSTVARGLAAPFDAVILDVDVMKTSFLQAGLSWDAAGARARSRTWATARVALAAGRSAVVDGPCMTYASVERGRRIAAQRLATYVYLECRPPSIAEVDRRLRSRTPLDSQRPSMSDPPRALHADVLSSADARALFRSWIDVMATLVPEALTVHTTGLPSECIDRAIRLIERSVRR